MTDSNAHTSWSSSKWLSKSAAARYIHRSPEGLQELLDSGEIPASVAPFERGGARVIYISIDDLDEYMRSTPYTPRKKRGHGGGSAGGEGWDVPAPRPVDEIPRYSAIVSGGKRARAS